MTQDWRRNVQESKTRTKCPMSPTMGYVIGKVHKNCEDVKSSVKTKKKMLSSIIYWDENDVNMSNRKAVHKHILMPVLRYCLSDLGAGSNTVSAVMRCMVPRYKMYKLHKDCKSKYIVRCLLGTMSCPYYRQIDENVVSHNPHNLYDLLVKITGTKGRKNNAVPNLICGVLDHWQKVHSEIRILTLLYEVQVDEKDKD
eukprot:5467358-Ditylum_brightwellii.AAC.1